MFGLMAASQPRKAAYTANKSNCVDIFTKRKRSEVMSLIRSYGNKATEFRLIQIFRANEITSWRRGSKLPLTPRRSKSQGASAKNRSTGKVRPDFVFPMLKLAVFVDGCFWHGCPQHATQPKTNAKFWRDKIAGNKARDKKVNRLLRAKGWKVIRVWQHELSRKNEAKLLKRLAPLSHTKASLIRSH